MNWEAFFTGLVNGGVPPWMLVPAFLCAIVIWKFKTISDCVLDHRKFSFDKDQKLRKIKNAAASKKQSNPSPEGSTPKK
jgi:hypothetical protein